MFTQTNLQPTCDSTTVKSRSQEVDAWLYGLRYREIHGEITRERKEILYSASSKWVDAGENGVATK